MILRLVFAFGHGTDLAQQQRVMARARALARSPLSTPCLPINPCTQPIPFSSRNLSYWMVQPAVAFCNTPPQRGGTRQMDARRAGATTPLRPPGRATGSHSPRHLPKRAFTSTGLPGGMPASLYRREAGRAGTRLQHLRLRRGKQQLGAMWPRAGALLLLALLAFAPPGETARAPPAHRRSSDPLLLHLENEHRLVSCLPWPASMPAAPPHGLQGPRSPPARSRRQRRQRSSGSPPHFPAVPPTCCGWHATVPLGIRCPTQLPAVMVRPPAALAAPLPPLFRAAGCTAGSCPLLSPSPAPAFLHAARCGQKGSVPLGLSTQLDYSLARWDLVPVQLRAADGGIVGVPLWTSVGGCVGAASLGLPRGAAGQGCWACSCLAETPHTPVRSAPPSCLFPCLQSAGRGHQCASSLAGECGRGALWLGTPGGQQWVLERAGVMRQTQGGLRQDTTLFRIFAKVCMAGQGSAM